MKMPKLSIKELKETADLNLEHFSKYSANIKNRYDFIISMRRWKIYSSEKVEKQMNEMSPEEFIEFITTRLPIREVPNQNDYKARLLKLVERVATLKSDFVRDSSFLEKEALILIN